MKTKMIKSVAVFALIVAAGMSTAQSSVSLGQQAAIILGAGSDSASEQWNSNNCDACFSA